MRIHVRFSMKNIIILCISYFAKNDNKDYIFGTSKNGQKEFVSVVKNQIW